MHIMIKNSALSVKPKLH